MARSRRLVTAVGLLAIGLLLLVQVAPAQGWTPIDWGQDPISAQWVPEPPRMLPDPNPNLQKPLGPCADAATCMGWVQLTSYNFNGTSLSNSVWSTYNGTNPASGEHWSSAQCTLSEGVLTLAASSNGLCGLTALRQYTYGKFELRAKFSAPADPNLNPVFLLWPELDSTWPRAGEIDAIEDHDPTRTSLQSWNHFADSNGQDMATYAGVYQVDMTQWHTYAIDWQRDYVTLYVDNVPWHVYTRHIPSGPMHPVIQIDATGPITSTASVELDWFRTYRS
ncbi:MAG TPA: glycoside hydrolase family 16 protein [Pseudonocardiaceae bacterium]|jgi:licheninase|nr:glycoside hydrolase family 16 protein [Pseudonocardiaceae bacterium]